MGKTLILKRNKDFKKVEEDGQEGQSVKGTMLNARSLDGRPKATRTVQKVAQFIDPKSPLGKKSNRQKLLNAIRMGASRTDAAASVGMHIENLRKFCRRHPEFGEEVEKAEVECKIHHLTKVHVGEADWRASAWFLSRKWRNEFGQRPADSYSKEQVQAMILGLSQIIITEIEDRKTRRQVMQEVGKLLNFSQELAAGKHDKMPPRPEREDEDNG